jgi:hypothetical protein
MFENVPTNKRFLHIESDIYDNCCCGNNYNVNLSVTFLDFKISGKLAILCPPTALVATLDTYSIYFHNTVIKTTKLSAIKYIYQISPNVSP